MLLRGAERQEAHGRPPQTFLFATHSTRLEVRYIRGPLASLRGSFLSFSFLPCHDSCTNMAMALRARLENLSAGNLQHTSRRPMVAARARGARGQMSSRLSTNGPVPQRLLLPLKAIGLPRTMSDDLATRWERLLTWLETFDGWSRADDCKVEWREVPGEDTMIPTETRCRGAFFDTAAPCRSWKRSVCCR